MTERSDAPLSERDALAEWVECEEFYNLMQTYRHAPFTDQARTIEAYRAVKGWIADFTLREVTERRSERLPPKESELERVLRLIVETPTVFEGKWIENCAGVFQAMAKEALKNAAPQGGQTLTRSEPSSPAGGPAESAYLGDLTDGGRPPLDPAPVCVAAPQEPLPGWQGVMAYLEEQYRTSKPAAEILDGLEKHIGQKLGIKNPAEYYRRSGERQEKGEKS